MTHEFEGPEPVVTDIVIARLDAQEIPATDMPQVFWEPSNLRAGGTW